jgi:hypothetical protein|tara:strand:- start:1761 stop:2510 length:750 start_codon:yes stop_codon:yes gene_type:complete
MASKNTYFIDVENVGSKTIAKFLAQDKSSDVVVVTGPHSNFQASGAVLEELSKGKNSRVDVIHTDISRDQLADKLLLIKVGEYRGRFPNRNLIIVSKDKGFKDAADIMNAHWSSNIEVRKDLPVGAAKKAQPAKKAQKKAQPAKKAQKQPQPQKKAQPAKKAQKQPQPQKNAQPAKKEQSKGKKSEWKKYWEIVSKRAKRNRAKTLDALISSIANISKTGIKADPDTVIHGLKSSQKISVKNGNVTWLD